MRHAMLAASFAALLALPVASLLFPPLRIALARQPIALPPIARAIDVIQAIVPANLTNRGYVLCLASSGVT